MPLKLLPEFKVEHMSNTLPGDLDFHYTWPIYKHGIAIVKITLLTKFHYYCVIKISFGVVKMFYML